MNCVGLFFVSMLFPALLLATTHVEEIDVRFMEKAPLIDGAPDLDSMSLPAYPLATVVKSNKSIALIEPHFHIGYGATFLYICIENNAPILVNRDRGYQNGDGVQVVIANPEADNAPTAEYYILGFSIQPGQNRTWQNKFVWYYNLNQKMLALEHTQFQAQTASGHSCMEMLIPWREVYPYQPFLSKGIGFNLCYIQAVGAVEKNQYWLFGDKSYFAEGRPQQYRMLKFMPPHVHEGYQLAYVAEASHIKVGAKLKLKLVTVCSALRSLRVSARVWSGEGEVLIKDEKSIDTRPPFTVNEVEVDTSSLPADGYRVSCAVNNYSPVDAVGFSILPPLDLELMRHRLRKVRDRLSSGSVHTLLFRLDDLQTYFAELKSYDTAAFGRMQAEEIQDTLEAAADGRDLIAERSGIFRRAYRSHFDESLQPYSIKVPANLDDAQTYPLLVFLHGKGQDDRGQLSSYVRPTPMLEMAPAGRGVAHAFATVAAQGDIAESISDVAAHYPVNKSCIILTGFSMGGYGVLRTFYQNPKMYKALAIFSGNPDLANHYFGGGQINFLDKKNLKVFKNIPIFIYHGERDMNCPVDVINQFVTLLKMAGARVEYHVEKDYGHDGIGPDGRAAFAVWLKSEVEDSGKEKLKTKAPLKHAPHTHQIK